MVIFFCPINDNACSGQLESTHEIQNNSLHPLAVKKLEGEIEILSDEKKTAEGH